MNMKRMFTSAIERTGDPTAPIKLQEAYSSASAIGKMLASTADQGKVEALTARLFKDFTDEELNNLSKSPEFIIALAACLSQSLIGFASNC